MLGKLKGMKGKKLLLLALCICFPVTAMALLPWRKRIEAFLNKSDAKNDPTT